MRLAVVVAVALLLFVGGAPAAPLTLKEKVNATGDVVVFDDFFEDTGEHAETPLFRAPRPGRFGQVRVGRLVEAARRVGLEWTPPAGLTRIRVTREITTIHVDEVSALIRRELAGALPEVRDPQDVEVDLPVGFRPVELVDVEKPHIAVGQLEIVPTIQRFRAKVTFSGGATPVSQTYEGRYSVNRKVPVLARSVDRGEIVMFEDVAWERMEERAIGDALMDADQIVGKAARRALAASRPLRQADLEAPRIVQRNQIVTISYRAPGMTLTARGRALRDAAAGEAVSVVNLQSNRTIEATATGPSRVSVSEPETPVRVAQGR